MAYCMMYKSYNTSSLEHMEEIYRNGFVSLVPMKYNVCTVCGREFVTTSQIMVNDARIATMFKEDKE